ncbi:signal transducer and transcription activator-like, partial [Sitodiplosis mosellana]|uniref:signal transducer and transcription activator-like n=1 Tax=Sitodiplosis mosellana TaxID=263140 RepID=UPI0024450BE9
LFNTVLNNIFFADEKIFGPSPKHDRLITWTQFCKNPLPGREFTFFHWFHDATKLTRSHLSKQWNKGLICGFISKDQAQKMLLKCAPGTFLLRFSDSQLGGISVAWVEKNDDDSLTVTHLEPFLSYDFENTKPYRSIGDFIEHISYCTHLYPDIPKHEAFGEFYTQVKRKSLEVYKAKQRFF